MIPSVTLVLGTCLSNALVLGADSITQVLTLDSNNNLLDVRSMIDRKLFKFARAGVATYGAGPPGVRVPDVIASEAQSDWSAQDAISFLQRRFKGADEMRALVGGVDDHGAPALWDVCMSGASPQRIVPLLGPLPIAVRGKKNLEVDQRLPGTPAGVIEQMLELFAENAGIEVGPPYEFLVIPGT